MASLGEQLDINNCPYCGVDTPNMTREGVFETKAYDDINNRFKRTWGIYVCKRCGGVVVASSYQEYGEVREMFPQSVTVDESIPKRANAFLSEALATIYAPSGSVMLAASAVDSMLKAKGYKEGSLFGRINKAKNDHLITEEMAKWAHEVRLDANGERHADEKELPTSKDAKRVIDFALALGEFLFVLPSRIDKGIKNATDKASER